MRRPLFWLIVFAALVLMSLSGLLREIPQWLWALIAAPLLLAGIVHAWRNGYLLRIVVAVLLFSSVMGLILLIPGGETGNRPAWQNLLIFAVPWAILLPIAWRTRFFDDVRKFFAEQQKKRPTACEECGVTTKATHYLDETWRGKFDGAKRYICSTCLQDALSAHLTVLDNRCALAEPSSKPKHFHNAYYAYTADQEDLKVASGATDREDVQRAEKALQTILDFASGSCRRCDQGVSNLVWIPGMLFRDSWTDFDLDIIAQSTDGLAPLCSSCSTQAIVGALVEKQIRIDEMWAPRRGTVLMFSGES